ncbi:MAG: transposase [Methanoculleus thermophilus]|nr:transposase [Methanoculleus thermophilus]
MCGHTSKGGRDGSSFRYQRCGFQLHADLNAARNNRSSRHIRFEWAARQPAECSASLTRLQAPANRRRVVDN